jgi:hypothetical protein
MTKNDKLNEIAQEILSIAQFKYSSLFEPIVSRWIKKMSDDDMKIFCDKLKHVVKVLEDTQ